jgi:hypothetical protein
MRKMGNRRGQTTIALGTLAGIRMGLRHTQGAGATRMGDKKMLEERGIGLEFVLAAFGAGGRKHAHLRLIAFVRNNSRHDSLYMHKQNWNFNQEYIQVLSFVQFSVYLVGSDGSDAPCANLVRNIDLETIRLLLI